MPLAKEVWGEPTESAWLHLWDHGPRSAALRQDAEGIGVKLPSRHRVHLAMPTGLRDDTIS